MVLVADYDIHKQNIGIRTDEKGVQHWARIDNGRALSYNVICNFDQGSLSLGTQTAENFKETMLSVNKLYKKVNKYFITKILSLYYGSKNKDTVYKEDLFKGINFACELNTEADKADTNKFRKVIKLSIANLEKAYGNNFLSIPEINMELKRRMGIDWSAKLTEELIENKVIENITRLRLNLKEMAKYEFHEAIKNIPNAVNTNRTIDYQKVLTHLDTTKSPRPNDLSLFIESAIKNNDLDGIKYLTEQSKSPMIIDGLSPIAYALKENKNELVVKMIESGLTLDEKDLSLFIKKAIKSNPPIKINGLSPIAYALKENKNELVVKMLESGLALDEKDLFLFVESTINNNLNGIEYLTKQSKPPMKINGLSPIAYALKENKNELAVKMIESGLPINSNDGTVAR